MSVNILKAKGENPIILYYGKHDEQTKEYRKRLKGNIKRDLAQIAKTHSLTEEEDALLKELAKQFTDSRGTTRTIIPSIKTDYEASADGTPGQATVQIGADVLDRIEPWQTYKDLMQTLDTETHTDRRATLENALQEYIQARIDNIAVFQATYINPIYRKIHSYNTADTGFDKLQSNGSFISSITTGYQESTEDEGGVQCIIDIKTYKLSEILEASRESCLRYNAEKTAYVAMSEKEEIEEALQAAAKLGIETTQNKAEIAVKISEAIKDREKKVNEITEYRRDWSYEYGELSTELAALKGLEEMQRNEELEGALADTSELDTTQQTETIVDRREDTTRGETGEQAIDFNTQIRNIARGMSHSAVAPDVNTILAQLDTMSKMRDTDAISTRALSRLLYNTYKYSGLGEEQIAPIITAVQQLAAPNEDIVMAETLSRAINNSTRDSVRGEAMLERVYKGIIEPMADCKVRGNAARTTEWSRAAAKLLNRADRLENSELVYNIYEKVKRAGAISDLEVDMYKYSIPKTILAENKGASKAEIEEKVAQHRQEKRKHLITRQMDVKHQMETREPMQSRTFTSLDGVKEAVMRPQKEIDRVSRLEEARRASRPQSAAIGDFHTRELRTRPQTASTIGCY